MNSKNDYTLGADIARLVRSWRSIIDLQLKPLGLTQTHWVTLYYLNGLPPNQSQIQLAKAIGIEQPSLVRTLDQLEGMGYVKREPILEQVNSVVDGVRKGIERDIPKEQLALFAEIIRKFEKNIADMEISSKG